MSKNTNRNTKSKSSKRTIKQDGYSSDNKRIIWRFDKIDRTEKFAFDLNREDFDHKEFMDKLLSYSTMTWAEAKRQTHDDGRSKNHSIDIASMSKEAKDRFKARELEDFYDAIFSFSLNNLWRIVGIRENEFFDVLWHDPNHEVCPSKLKHT